jgi:hypothetical protein
MRRTIVGNQDIPFALHAGRASQIHALALDGHRCLLNDRNSFNAKGGDPWSIFHLL